MIRSTALRSTTIVATVGAALLFAGCASDAPDGGASPNTEASTAIAGGLFCSGAPLGSCNAAGGEAEGILPELAQAWAQHLPEHSLTVEGMSWDALMPAAVSGRVDLIIGLGDQEARRQEFTFVDLFQSNYSIIASADNSDAASSPEELCGQKGVAATGSAELEALKLMSDEHCAGDPIVISEVSEMNVGFVAVQSGQADYTITDSLSALPLLEGNDGVYSVAFAYTAKDGTLWGVAIPNSNTELIAAVSDAVSKARADGSLAAVLESYGADPDMILAEDMVNGAPTD